MDYATYFNVQMKLFPSLFWNNNWSIWAEFSYIISFLKWLIDIVLCRLEKPPKCINRFVVLFFIDNRRRHKKNHLKNPEIELFHKNFKSIPFKTTTAKWKKKKHFNLIRIAKFENAIWRQTSITVRLFCSHIVEIGGFFRTNLQFRRAKETERYLQPIISLRSRSTMSSFFFFFLFSLFFIRLSNKYRRTGP